MSSHTFTCAQCGETFRKAWTDEEAAAEAEARWADLDSDDSAVVCDDCFKQFISRVN